MKESCLNLALEVAKTGKSAGPRAWGGCGLDLEHPEASGCRGTSGAGGPGSRQRDWVEMQDCFCSEIGSCALSWVWGWRRRKKGRRRRMEGGNGPWKCSKMPGNTKGPLQSVIRKSEHKDSLSSIKCLHFILNSYHFLNSSSILVYKSLKPAQILSPIFIVSEGKSCGFCARYISKQQHSPLFAHFHRRHFRGRLCSVPSIRLELAWGKGQYWPFWLLLQASWVQSREPSGPFSPRFAFKTSPLGSSLQLLLSKR